MLPSKVLHATKVAVPSHAMVIQVANYLSISVMVVSLTWDDLCIAGETGSRNTSCALIMSWQQGSAAILSDQKYLWET